MIADIAHGHVDGADILFLVAAIVFGIAAIAVYIRQAVPRDWVPALVPVGLCLLAIAWLIL